MAQEFESFLNNLLLESTMNSEIQDTLNDFEKIVQSNVNPGDEITPEQFAALDLKGKTQYVYRALLENIAEAKSTGRLKEGEDLNALGILGQILLETGNFRSSLNTKYFNFGGHKADKWWKANGGEFVSIPPAYGKNKEPVDWRKYSTLKEGLKGKIDFFIDNSRYRKNGVMQAKTPAQHLLAAQKAGYAGTEENYAKLSMERVNKLPKLLQGYDENIGKDWTTINPASDMEAIEAQRELMAQQNLARKNNQPIPESQPTVLNPNIEINSGPAYPRMQIEMPMEIPQDNQGQVMYGSFYNDPKSKQDAALEKQVEQLLAQPIKINRYGGSLNNNKETKTNSFATGGPGDGILNRSSLNFSPFLNISRKPNYIHPYYNIASNIVNPMYGISSEIPLTDYSVHERPRQKKWHAGLKFFAGMPYSQTMQNKNVGLNYLYSNQNTAGGNTFAYIPTPGDEYMNTAEIENALDYGAENLYNTYGNLSNAFSQVAEDYSYDPSIVDQAHRNKRSVMARQRGYDNIMNFKRKMPTLGAGLRLQYGAGSGKGGSNIRTKTGIFDFNTSYDPLEGIDANVDMELPRLSFGNTDEVNSRGDFTLDFTPLRATFGSKWQTNKYREAMDQLRNEGAFEGIEPLTYEFKTRGEIPGGQGFSPYAGIGSKLNVDWKPNFFPKYGDARLRFSADYLADFAGYHRGKQTQAGGEESYTNTANSGSTMGTLGNKDEMGTQGIGHNLNLNASLLFNLGAGLQNIGDAARTTAALKAKEREEQIKEQITNKNLQKNPNDPYYNPGIRTGIRTLEEEERLKKSWRNQLNPNFLD